MLNLDDLHQESPPEAVPASSVVSAFAVLAIGLDRSDLYSGYSSDADPHSVLALCIERVKSALRGQDAILRSEAGVLTVILNPIRSSKDAELVANRLIDLLQRPYTLMGRTTHIAVSVGLSLSSQNISDLETLTQQAAMALRMAKSWNPGAAYVFEDDMEAKLMVRHSLISDLTEALALNQFEVHYQPHVQVSNNRLIGFEALLRWKHPKRGWISPGEFIPLAEEIGIISNLGGWVLTTACMQAAHLPKSVIVSVNASPIQLRTGTLLPSVRRALSAAALEPERLAIEITEGVLLDDSSVVQSTLLGLHNMGVKLAMDDFGIGYSSLGQLARFPFDVIKIDRSLVGRNTKQRAIIRAITMLGRELGISTLLEGIETQEELSNATLDGCTSVQGFFFSKAVPAAHLTQMVDRFSGN